MDFDSQWGDLMDHGRDTFIKYGFPTRKLMPGLHLGSDRR
jgi:hypothetical protein